MKRSVLLILLLLVGGAIVNVAVAWGCALRAGTDVSTSDSRRRSVDEALSKWWEATIPFPHHKHNLHSEDVESNPPRTDQHRLFFRDTGLTTEHISTSPRETVRLLRCWAGLPCRAISGEQWTVISVVDVGAKPVVDRKVVLRWARDPGRLALPAKPKIDDIGSMFGRIIPLKPIWPGFAANTVFYAVILWGLFAAPFALRRRMRIKRGLCPKCAYPRGAGTSAVCTECGAKAVPP